MLTMLLPSLLLLKFTHQDKKRLLNVRKLNKFDYINRFMFKLKSVFFTHNANCISCYRKLMDNQVALSEAERENILHEHEKQMVNIENRLVFRLLVIQ